MAFTCDGCSRRTSGSPRVSLTGRSLCPTCADGLAAAAAGVITGGGTAGAIATQGWLFRVREARRRRKAAEGRS
ncbi:MAG: hypothetical protein GXX79_14385 [Actinomycetales bacterium]|nr:hypothetical protein [Actinomycetales bacterium]